jgi:hypothetical protein
MSSPSAAGERPPVSPELLGESPRIALIGDVQGYAHRLEAALRTLGAVTERTK